MTERSARPAWAERLHSWEHRLVGRFSRHERRARLRAIMLLGTRGADGWALLLILPGVALLFGRRGLEAIVAGAASGLLLALLVFVIKQLVRRARPADLDLARPIGAPDLHAFPSGHTAHAFSATTALFVLHPVAGLLFLPLAVLVGASRVFFGLHYPSDVLAGAALGVLTFWLTVLLVHAQGWLPAFLPAG